MLGTTKRHLAAHTLDITGSGRLLRSMPAWQGVVVLNYHRIGAPGCSKFDHNLWSATADDFERQVRMLCRDFDVIGLADLDLALSDPRGRFVMITFDDGYRDNYSVAFPILKSLGATATFFIATGFIDRPRVPWWDEIAWMARSSPRTEPNPHHWLETSLLLAEPKREPAVQHLLRIYKTLGSEATDGFLDFVAEELESGRCPPIAAESLWMTWEMLREMRDAGMSFGGHTVNHPILANLSSDQQDWEIGECQRRLAAELNQPITAFSYPNGQRSCFNEFTRAALRHFGFRWAFAFDGGYCRPGHEDWLCLSRTAVETEIDLPLFRATVTLPQWFA